MEMHHEHHVEFQGEPEDCGAWFAAAFWPVPRTNAGCENGSVIRRATAAERARLERLAIFASKEDGFHIKTRARILWKNLADSRFLCRRVRAR